MKYERTLRQYGMAGKANTVTLTDTATALTITVDAGDPIAYTADGTTDHVTADCHDVNGVQAAKTTCAHEPGRFFSKYQYGDCLRRSTARIGRSTA